VTILDERLRQCSEDLQEKMRCLLPKTGPDEARLVDAMRYSALAPGKRLRPFLVVESASLFGVARASALQVASAIEFLHTYSLVHDDLPAMDDDATRRGQPSCHVQFDEATAILAGDALLTLAFEILADEGTHMDPKVRCDLIQTFAVAGGVNGMVGGQMIDILSEGQELNIDQIIRLQRLKTGKLFAVSCEAGAILGKAPQRLRQALLGYAHDIGLAFQITDDLLDVEETRERQNKSAGKPTLVSVLGTDRAREQAEMLARQAERHLDVFDERADVLRRLARFVVERRG
jgi:farnesyl diphosphate synthase